MERVIGIDLGTTNSCVAVVEGGVPRVLPLPSGHRTMPSMLAIDAEGKRLVGHVAQRQSLTNAENTVIATKRLIGCKYDSPPVRTARESVAYTIVEGPHGDPRVELQGSVYSPQEISAMILQELKLVAEDHYPNDEIRRAVITCPAYFNDSQRQATKDAGQIAGLEVMRVINEPTAAALAYGYGKDQDALVAVFDLGGGTFDISILEIGEGGVFKVVATAGDTHLGGEDFDSRIIDWLRGAFLAEQGVDLLQNRPALQRLRDAAETAKRELSLAEETEINLPFIVPSEGRRDALHLQRRITRDDLLGLCGDLIDNCMAICKRTLDDAMIDVDEIDQVLLVGGMTRVPLIRAAVGDYFGIEPVSALNPDEVVALGAAVQAQALVEQSENLILLDVTPHALGLMIHGDQFEQLIAPQSTVPTSTTMNFTTSSDNQTAVKFLVMQREANADQLLGEFILSGLRRAPKGAVEIEVTFSIDADGITHVTAIDLETRREQSIDVRASGGLTDDEIDDMVADAQDYMLSRKQGDSTAVERAEQLIRDIEAILPDVDRIVGGSEFGRVALGKAHGVLASAKRALDDGNAGVIKESNEALARTLQMFNGVVSRS